jgi:nitrous oxidase accessory protein
VLVLLLTGGVEAATLVVCPSGCAFSSIQTAINASNNGDTIQVQSGTYHENVNVTKQLTPRGIGNTVVDGGGSGSSIKLSANGITLEGFTATGGGYLPDAGIKVTSNNNMLIGNNVSNNKNYGIYLLSSSNSNIFYNNFFNNINNIYI